VEKRTYPATRGQLCDLVKAAVELAVVRHDLQAGDEGMDEARRGEIALDTWNALNGIDTCSGEMAPELREIVRGE
jgi:hypothetical protein